MEELAVGLIQLFEVAAFDHLLEGDAAALYAFEEHIHRCLQVDDQLRARRARHQAVEDHLVEAELLWREVDLGEEAVFLDQIVGNAAALEEICLPQ